MFPRAACRLEELGFETVYDYELGITDWKAAGLQIDGGGPIIQMAIDALRPDVPTCAPEEPVGMVRTRVEDAGWEDCVVVDCGDQVVGRLRSRSWDADPQLTVADVMESGPTTVRPNEPLDGLVKRMDKRPTPLVVVATPQGVLLGVVLREDARRLLSGEPPEMVWAECEGCPGQWRPVA